MLNKNEQEEPVRIYGWPPISTSIKHVLFPNHVIDCDVILVENEGDYHVEPMCILDQKVKVLMKKYTSLVKVQWTYYGLEDTTWEHEEAMRKTYLQMFANFEKE
jgi:hypothetical protein